MPPQTQRRYLVEKKETEFTFWRFNHKRDTLPRGRKLRIEVLAPATIHWTKDAWKSSEEISTMDTTLGVHFADLPTTQMNSGEEVAFTFFWPAANKWEGDRFTIRIEER